VSYRCGIGGRLSGAGFSSEPVIICDGCGDTHAIASKVSFTPEWFLRGKPPRGWRGLRMADGSKRWDLCPGCWKLPPRGE
jgi:hypothetical protein